MSTRAFSDQRVLLISAELCSVTLQLRDYGTMSSATIFFVLEALLKAGAPRPGQYGVLAVLGPGFSCELALIRG